VFIEASYANAQPEGQLFGHLTPTLLLRELAVLSELAGAGAVRGLPVVVTHCKPTAGNEEAIRAQLTAANTLQLRLIFPQQGQRLEF
jgi:cAMP phosphodiesterase